MEKKRINSGLTRKLQRFKVATKEQYLRKGYYEKIVIVTAMFRNKRKTRSSS